MNHKTKVLLTALLVLVTVLIFAGCGEKDRYALNDEEGYKVSVKYHTNGGQFDTNTYVLTDSYNISGKTKNSNGKIELALLDPADPQRTEPKQAENNGYFLAGWYTERTDTGKKDEKGNPIYTYSGYWDFSADVLEVDPSKSYSSAEPVLELYAAWVPNFTFEFYDLSTGELVNSTPIDPTDAQELSLELSTWDKSTGLVNKKDVPVKDGYTFNGLYLDEKGEQKVEEAAINHRGTLDLETATATEPAMKLYVDYIEGEYVAVYTPDKLLDKLSSGKDIMVMEDMDFTDVQWPADLVEFGYDGRILGNGHKLSNITLEFAPQSLNTNIYEYAGLFGQLGETAAIFDLTFENVKFQVKEGSRGLGVAEEEDTEISIGLLAGVMTEGAQLENVTFVNCVIELDVTIETYDYKLGLVTATQGVTLDTTGITVVLTGEGSEDMTAQITEGLINVVKAEDAEEDEEAENQ